METALDILVAVLLAVGVAATVLGAIGMLRMPDTYTRMLVASKASTLGLGSVYIGVAIHFASLGDTSRALLVIVFAFLTIPAAAHALGRAAYRAGIPMWHRTIDRNVDGTRDS